MFDPQYPDADIPPDWYNVIQLSDLGISNISNNYLSNINSYTYNVELRSIITNPKFRDPLISGLVKAYGFDKNVFTSEPFLNKFFYTTDIIDINLFNTFCEKYNFQWGIISDFGAEYQKPETKNLTEKFVASNWQSLPMSDASVMVMMNNMMHFSGIFIQCDIVAP